ncbi:MAG: XdhC family protein [Gammaproteobacteria bacterium]|nr:XdhC family protein [Gammaproteobacteria bacterium]
MDHQYVEFVIPQLNKWSTAGHRTALLTLTHIDGSSPYPIGSQMLVREDGSSYGMITGGCIEAALIDEALAALQAQQNRSQRYGKGSPYIDIQLPCGSGLDIYFDVAPDATQCQQIEGAIEQRQPAELEINSEPPFRRQYLPRRRIVVIGQGSIHAAFLPIARAAGYQVEEVAINQPAIAFDPWTAAVCLFHDHDKELDFLAQACHSNCFYIGALGSHRAHQTRRMALLESGMDDALLEKIHSPAGLDIGSKTPHEIAISILAQIVDVGG